MIVVDSSILVAISLEEPGYEAYRTVLKNSSRLLMSTVSLLESRIVIQARKVKQATLTLDTILQLPLFEFIPPDLTEIDIAAQAFTKYGKGQGHKAQLNICDLFSYALAKNRDLPLLFKGEDFALTDVKRAF